MKYTLPPTRLFCLRNQGIATMANRRLVTTVTMKHLEMQTFRSGGPGGQKQNKVSTGVRLIHPPSGARGESREHKSQTQNKKAAFRRLALTKEFQDWARLEAARDAGILDVIERKVDAQMRTDNLRIEVKACDGSWMEEDKVGCPKAV